MTEKSPRYDALDLLLLIGSLLGLLLGVVGAGSLLALAPFLWLTQDGLNAITTATNAGAFAFMALFSLVGVVVSARALLGHEPPRPRKPPGRWLALSMLFPGILALGRFTLQQDSLRSFLFPPIHILAASIPVFFVVALVYRRVPLVSQRRFWGQLLTGIWAMPALALILELIALIAVVALVLVAILTAPGGPALLESMVSPQELKSPSDIAQWLPLLERPWVLVIALGYVTVLIPLLEEAIKTMVVWPLLRRELTDAEAFFGGVLGGGGYALVEALFLSQPGSDWTIAMVARAGATCMHMFTAGITCWGLVRLTAKGRWLRSAAVYLGAVVMHGLWNTAAVGVGLPALTSESSFDLIPARVQHLLQFVSLSILVLLSLSAILGLLRLSERWQPQGAQKTPSKHLIRPAK